MNRRCEMSQENKTPEFNDVYDYVCINTCDHGGERYLKGVPYRKTEKQLDGAARNFRKGDIVPSHTEMPKGKRKKKVE